MTSEQNNGDKKGGGDHLERLFNNIDWASRVRSDTDRRPGLGSQLLATTFMHKYLWYQLEPEQLDLDNPFHVEEGNCHRPHLKVKKKGKKDAVELDLVTEGMKEVFQDKEEAEQLQGEEEEDFMDEYGNIKTKEEMEEAKKLKKEQKDKQSRQRRESTKKAMENLKTKEDSKKLRKRFDARKHHAELEVQAEASIWNDLDADLARREGVRCGKKDLFSGNSLHFEFPRPSSLGQRDQANFLNMLNRFKRGTLHASEEQLFREMQAVVAEERAEFSKFSREMCEDKSDQYEFILPGLDKYVTEHRSCRKQRVIKHPRYWKMLRDVRMGAARKEQGDSADLFYLSHVDLILERGVLPLGNLPIPIKTVLPQKYERLVHKYPADPTITPGTQGMPRSLGRHFRATENEPTDSLMSGETLPDNKYLHNLSTMEDPNAVKIAALYLPDVIISASALKCIVDNFYPSFSRSWDIPVFVQEFAPQDRKSGNKSVIFIGKPFLSKRVTACDRNKLAFKYAARTWMNRDWGTEGKSKSNKNKNTEQGSEKHIRLDMAQQSYINAGDECEDDFLFDANLDELETFGESSSKIEISTPISQKKVKISHTQGTDDKSEREDGSGEKVQNGVNLKETPENPISQLDGSISALSFSDLNLENYILSDLMADNSKIVFEPGSLNDIFLSDENGPRVSEKMYSSQLDGAFSSDDEEGLTIDLGNAGKNVPLNNEKPPEVTKKRNSSGLVESSADQKPGRRSKRLKAQMDIEKDESAKKENDHYDEMGEIQKEMERLKEECDSNAKRKKSKRAKKAIINEPTVVDVPPQTVQIIKTKTSTTVDEKTPLPSDNSVPVKEEQANEASKSLVTEGNTLTEPSVEATGILDSLLSGQTALHRKQQVPKQRTERSDYRGEQLNTGAPCLGPLDECLPPLPGSNYSYRLWNLTNTKKRNSNIRMVIRSKIPSFSRKAGVLVPSIKLEYQTTLGAEQCTVSECSRDWIDNIIRPAASTIRFRVNPATGQVLMYEKLDLNKIREEGAHEHRQLGDDGSAPDRFDPSMQLANLHNLVSELKNLKAGTYLLSHDIKSGAFCRLYQATEKGSSDFDLHDSYAKVNPEEVTKHVKIPWRQIDYNLVTPWHFNNKRVPGTFQPVNRKYK